MDAQRTRERARGAFTHGSIGREREEKEVKEEREAWERGPRRKGRDRSRSAGGRGRVLGQSILPGRIDRS